MRDTHRRHARECCRKLCAVVRELSQPKPLLIFIHIHRHDRDFITRRQFSNLIFHRLENLGALQESSRTIFSKIENQNQCEWLALLAFAREVSDIARLAVVEHLEILSSEI